ncbi:MAG: drug/metabolite exporter YedA [Anaerolineae bacterium]|nr:drug/metabolite exporter YedA [Anaerolineae bacterium]
MRDRRAALALTTPVLLALLAVYLIWGSTYFAIRIGLESFPPLLMGGLRFMAAGAIMLIVLRLRGTPMPTWREWRWALVFGVLIPGMGNGGVTFAEQSVSSSTAALVIATVPLWASIWASLRGKRPSAREWIGVVLGFAGIILLNLDSEISANPLGFAILLVSAMSWAYGSVWKRDVRTAPGLLAVGAEMLCAGFFLTALGLLRGEQITQAPSLESVLALLHLLFIGALIGYSAYSYLLRTVTPSLATSYAYVNPVIAVLIGLGLGGETLGRFGVLAMLFIVGGVVLILTGHR